MNYRQAIEPGEERDFEQIRSTAGLVQSDDDGDDELKPRPFDPKVGRPVMIVPDLRSSQPGPQEALRGGGTLVASDPEDIFGLLNEPEWSDDLDSPQLFNAIDGKEASSTYFPPEQRSSNHQAPSPLFRPTGYFNDETGKLQGIGYNERAAALIPNPADAPPRPSAPKSVNDFDKSGGQSLAIQLQYEPVPSNPNLDPSHVSPRGPPSAAMPILPSPHSRNAFANNHHAYLPSSNRSHAVATKPLSAYNYFFADMRDWILNLSEKQRQELLPSCFTAEDQKGSGQNISQAAREVATVMVQMQKEKQPLAEHEKRLLNRNLNKSHKAQRRHRKVHGKMGFRQLNSMVSSAWNALPHTDRSLYYNLAKKDRQ
eukprot:CAMPEP_0176009264 /NCGR_PEP_ID=MMETSP0120_2-20121206/4163_1 /TAXON_ID=160619 /ORGANISM="Kryptoperidinium foliaceum, Strain CCMP 1326" /LENGTH=369 /DNA_ID=CAMNT_0017342059 /DNA_START=243 /DNA_END=1349 /DNA_ORIENTATION=+